MSRPTGDDRTRALSVTCPICAAEPEAPCIGAGKLPTDLHGARLTSYWKAHKARRREERSTAQRLAGLRRQATR